MSAVSQLALSRPEAFISRALSQNLRIRPASGASFPGGQAALKISFSGWGVEGWGMAGRSRARGGGGRRKSATQPAFSRGYGCGKILDRGRVDAYGIALLDDVRHFGQCPAVIVSGIVKSQLLGAQS